MPDPKTQPTEESVAAFIERVEPPRRRDDALRLDALFRRASGFAPRIWRPSIVGYGRYDYRYPTGRAGSFLATGFAPRRAEISVYILPGYADFSAILDRLGPHRTGRSCLYVRRLDAIDLGALEDLVRAGLEDLARRWPVHAD